MAGGTSIEIRAPTHSYIASEVRILPAMTGRRRARLMTTLFLGLFILHIWLLQRTVARGDVLVSILLAVAIALFLQRLVHYAKLWKRPRPERVRRDAHLELLHVRKRTLVFVILTAMHAFVLWRFVGTEELWIVVLLAASMALFFYRTAAYTRRYVALRHPV